MTTNIIKNAASKLQENIPDDGIFGDAPPLDDETPVEKYDTSATTDAMTCNVKVDVDRVKEGWTEVENVIKAGTIADQIATEMMSLISTNGKIDPIHMAMFGQRIESVESLMGNGFRVDVPSFEHFVMQQRNGSNLAYDSTVSLEGIMQVWHNVNDAFINATDFVIRATFTAIKSMLPIYTEQRKRIKQAQGMIRNANREAGMKEVDGPFTAALTIDGTLPTPETLIDNLKYQLEVANQLLSTDHNKEVISSMSNTIQEIYEFLEAEDVSEPSAWMYPALWIYTAALDLAAPGLGQIWSGVVVQTGNVFSGKVMQGVPMAAKQLPSFSRMYPIIAQVAAAPNDPRIKVMRSKPLLGNKALVTKDLNFEYQLKKSEKNGANISEKFGLDFIPFGQRGPGGAMRALTSQEQNDVLSMTDSLLDFGSEHMRRDTTLLKQRFTEWRNLSAKTRAIYDDRFVGPKRHLALLGLRAASKYMMEGYWQGVVKTQTSYAKYIGDISRHLITYTVKSMSASQAESVRDGGSDPSNI